MPVIPAGEIFPEQNAITFTAWSGTIRYPYLPLYDYSGYSCQTTCFVYSYEDYIIASAENIPSSTSYTQDGKIVYFAGGTGQSVGTVDANPSIPKQQITSAERSVYIQNKDKIAWAMVYGGYAGKTITTNLTHVTGAASNPTSIPDGESATLTFTAEEGYGLPSSITVTNCEYTWDKTTGTLVLSNPTDNVTVTITGVSLLSIDLKTMEGWIDLSEGQYAVQLRARDTTGVYAPSRLSNTVYVTRTYATYSISTTLSHVSTIGFVPTTIEEFGQATLVFEADTGYMLPASITVTGAEYSWDPAQGTLSIYNPSGNVAITISGRIPGAFTIPAQTFDGCAIPELIYQKLNNPFNVGFYSSSDREGTIIQSETPYHDVLYCNYKKGSGNATAYFVFASDVSGVQIKMPQAGNIYYSNYHLTSTFTYDGKTVYYYDGNNGSIDNIDGVSTENNLYSPGLASSYYARVAWLMIYGGYTD